MFLILGFLYRLAPRSPSSFLSGEPLRQCYYAYFALYLWPSIENALSSYDTPRHVADAIATAPAYTPAKAMIIFQHIFKMQPDFLNFRLVAIPPRRSTIFLPSSHAGLYVLL